MLVPKLLTETLEDLLQDDFKKFKSYLSMNVLDGRNPIGKGHLEHATQMQTVSKMIESYGEESAVNVTVEILKAMNLNGSAETLESRYEAIKSATPASSSSSSSSSSAAAPPAAPAGMVAQHGALIIAPNVAGGTSGSWNININK